MIQRCLIMLFVFTSIVGCKQNPGNMDVKLRNVVDTIGFAKYNWQMDSIMSRLNVSPETDKTWRVVISPHDDYAYVGSLYPELFKAVKAKTIILFGVAHKAKNFNLENKIVFDSFDAWSAPYGNAKVSALRDEIITKLPDSLYVVHDELQAVEHSLEALIPFLQYYNKDVEIIPILVPYMPFEKMQEIAKSFSKAVNELMLAKNMDWGKDIAIVISSDAVHYGDEGWGDKNYAFYGTDSIGLIKAYNHELEILNSCLVDEITKDKIQKFVNYTVEENDYKEYKWTWCGRYSIPMGLLCSQELDKLRGEEGLSGTFVGYSNSINHATLQVEDLNMGTTAPANIHHWVGYPAVGYQ